MLPTRPCKKRVSKDIYSLVAKKYQVKTLKGSNKFSVKFFGPTDTPYEGGVWLVIVKLPENYPFEPPIVGFWNTIFHPNIDEKVGSICLDALREKWSAIYDLSHIFETFLPQLLTYPNPEDPVNARAASIMIQKPDSFKLRVREYIRKYATERRLKEKPFSRQFCSDWSSGSTTESSISTSESELSEDNE